MKIRQLLTVVFVFASAASASVSASAETRDDLPVVGLTQNDIALPVSQRRFTQLFSQAISATHDSVLPVLHSQAARPGWMLRDVAVGVGLKVSVGLGPIYNVSAKPKVRLIFSNSTHPKAPD